MIDAETKIYSAIILGDRITRSQSQDRGKALSSIPSSDYRLLCAMEAMIIENEEKMVKFVGKTSCKWTILLLLSVKILRSSFCGICEQINSPV